MDTKPIDISEFVLKYLIEDEEAMKSLIAMFLNKVMQHEACLQVGCEPYERCEERKDYRNGSKPRQLTTRFGKVVLEKPQLRRGEFETCVVDRYSHVEKALVAACAESYYRGASTRDVMAIMQHLGVEVDKSALSRMTGELDVELEAFRTRPIEKKILFLYVDAAYLKIRENHRYVTKALFIAVGIREDGYKEVLGTRLADNEGEEFWLEFFESLKERGLRGVELVISDGHQGIKSAVKVCFNGASWQMCNVHFRRLAMKLVPMKDRQAVNSLVKKGMESPEDLLRVSSELEPKYPRVCRLIEKYYYDLFNYQAYPMYMWKKLRTTNMLERTIGEIKRRTKVIGAFPDKDSAMRVATTILMNTEEEWIKDKRHILIETDQETEKEAKIELEEQG
jgi:transposase-like protein